MFMHIVFIMFMYIIPVHLLDEMSSVSVFTYKSGFVHTDDLYFME